ncbi:MAG: lipoyl synthase [Chloroflexota bacterium]
MHEHVRRPEWLKPVSLDPVKIERMNRLMRGLKLHTVCESAMCPNRSGCFADGTATFMILGNTCTRNCTFCAVTKGKPEAVDPEEPAHVVAAVAKLGLKYVVITSVTRDDLPDDGAAHFVRTVRALYESNPALLIEVLVPDFGGSSAALQTLLNAHPTILNHNMETVPRLYREVRPEADYGRSLTLLRQAKWFSSSILTKSGLMVGLGETSEEVMQVMADLRGVKCDILTIGQYLAPSAKHHRIVRYILPQEFEEYRNAGLKMGFAAVLSGPLVRSSFHASEAYQKAATTAKRKGTSKSI